MTTKRKLTKPYTTDSERHVIIVDPGKNGVKAWDVVGGTVREILHFDSKQIEVLNFHPHKPGDNRFLFEYNETKFLVGNFPKIPYNTQNTKTTLHHQICIYTAIAKFVKDGESIDLVIGCPSTDYNSEDEYLKYKEMMFGTPGEEIVTYLNGERKGFFIRNHKLGLYPEGTAYYTRLMEAEKTGSQAYHIVDMGGKNVNHREFDETGNCEPGWSSDKAGMNALEQRLRMELRQAIDGNVFNVETVNFVKAIQEKRIVGLPELKGYESFEEFLYYNIKEYLITILQAELSTRVDLSIGGHRIIFTGGGSMLLKEYILDVFPTNAHNFIFSNHAIYDNCTAYLMHYIMDQVYNGELAPELGHAYFNELGKQLASNNFVALRKKTSSQFSFGFTA